MKYSAAVITISDKGFRGERQDTSGPALCSILEENGWDVCYRAVVADEADQIQEQLLRCSDELGVNLVLTTGGTGFSPRDITPEATKEIIERETPGIPEAMRAESMKITPRGCLSRSYAGIRRRTLIINLPGSEKAAKENLLAVLNSIRHGVDMLLSAGSADCASTAVVPEKKKTPSMEQWLQEAKKEKDSEKCGMYLFHNGVVRSSAKAQVRENIASEPVTGMKFSFDKDKTADAVEKARQMPGIYHVRVWMNEGNLSVGDDIMLVLVGGDIRPHVIAALENLVGDLKTHCVCETELN